MPLQSAPISNLVSEEVNFPRGGGTSFTPFEVKTIRAEGAKEAEDELFKEKLASAKRRKTDGKATKTKAGKQGSVRIEHLNYKRLAPGMKIMGQVYSIQPLALVISLPNQLFGHIPITNITSQLTARLEALEQESEKSNSEAGEDEDDQKPPIPELFELFQPGQYVRTVVTAVHAPGATTDTVGLSRRARDEVEKASRRVELSLAPEQVNADVTKSDVKAGFVLSTSVQSIEDHGYLLDLGIAGISGFLSFDEAKKGPWSSETKLPVGMLLELAVSSISKNGRTCTMSADQKSIHSATLTEASNPTSLLPGTLVQSLITAVGPTGVNLQVLGFYEGTVDRYHLIPGDPEENYKVGKKVKARILYRLDTSSPPRFALSLAPHVIHMGTKRVDEDQNSANLQDAFPIGTTVDAARVTRVESEHGLVVEVQPGLEGFVHISQVSDDHVPALEAGSGSWKVGTIHPARVTGYIPFDGLLQLSLKPSVLQQKFLQVSELPAGEIVKGTIKRLTDSALFVSLSGSVDGVVWPNHYADIALKQPQKRFKPGTAIRCRVLVVDPERRRIVLTAKKTLVDSELPRITSWEDAKPGVVTYGVVFRASSKALHVEFYNNMKAFIPLKEISDSPISSLEEGYPAGKIVKVKIISVDEDERKIVASIRQGIAKVQPEAADVNGVEIGDIVTGQVAEVHKDNVVLTLTPSRVRALVSLNNLANHRGVTVTQLRAGLTVGSPLEHLVVVSRNIEKGLVIVANKPQQKAQLDSKGNLTWETAQVGQVVGGRVLRYSRRGTNVKLGKGVVGALHPTDCSDDYEQGACFPAVDTVIKAVIIEVNKEQQRLVLSTRQSRMHSQEFKSVVDREIESLNDLAVGQTVRGFIKSVAEHGLFISLGRDIDARVQIRELFDEFVKDWKERFQPNQLVKGRIMKLDIEKKQVEMTFRSGDRSQPVKSELKLSDLSERQIIDGHVKKVEDYGIFIQIGKSKLSGLCHKSELSDNLNADVTLALRSFREGDVVKAIILSIDHEKRRISLGLKPSYFQDEDIEMATKELDENTSESDHEPLGVVPDTEEEDPDIADSDTGSNNGGAEGAFPIVDDRSEADSESDEVERMDLDFEGTSTTLGTAPAIASSNPSQAAPALALKGGFQWTAPEAEFAQDGSDSDSEADDEDSSSHKKKKKRKEIEQDLTAEMHTRAPESTADFERLLLGSPNSSYIWIRYMSFQLQLSEVDKAREIGRRALRTISFREEHEKLNVWVALLNLENVYGSDKSLDVVFKEAARSNDSKTVHLRLASIFDQSDKHEKAVEQYKKTAKKFGFSSKVWTLYGEYLMRNGQLEEARKLLPRSMQSLEKRKHLKTVSKFAQLEYKLGDPERGKTLFEGIVTSHPKRFDLWSIYMDMEVGQGALQNLRNLFNRVLAIKMTSHKAKAFFKKWLEIERNIGDEGGQALVKRRAVEWTQRAVGNESV